jgi:hypothetical protein
MGSRPAPALVRRRVAIAGAALILIGVSDAQPTLAQHRVVLMADGSVDQPIGRWRRRTRDGLGGGIAVETGDRRSSAAWLVTFSYAHLESNPIRAFLHQGDLDVWRLTIGGIRRTSPSRPFAVLIAVATGVSIVEEASYSNGNATTAPQTTWDPLLSAGVGAEYRRRSLLVRLRSELWVHPLTYSPDAYGSPAAVRTTLGIGLRR